VSGEEVVIVTGAARGIGRAYTLALANAGYRVMVADLLDGAAVVHQVEDAGGTAGAVTVDVQDRASTEAMVRATLERFGRVDVLINNAAYFTAIHKKPFDELTDEEWDRAFAVNVRGSWLCAVAAAAPMKRQRAGKIINTSSMVVPSGIPFFLHYLASKAAVIGLTRGLARELGDYGITVNTISPDYIPHDAEYAGRQPEMADLLAAGRCIKRDSVPADLIGTILYLAGRGSDFVTGQNILVNGGRIFS